MKTVLVVLTIVFFGVTTSYGGAWGPIGSSSTYNYINDEGELLEVTYSSNGNRTSRYHRYWGAVVSETMIEDTLGNVFLTYSGLYHQGAIDPDYGYSFDPGLMVLDFPLSVGEAWAASGVGSGFYEPTCEAEFQFHVVSELEVSVPAGVFSVYEVSLVNQSCLDYPQSGSYFLSPEFGPIILPGGFMLLDINGVVSGEETSFGGLKALYR